MDWFILISIAVVWLACSVLSYQYTRTYYRWEFPTLYEDNPVDRDRVLHRRALGLAPFGPIALATGLLINDMGRHGRNWKVRA